ncbi:hypothetical protein Spith_0232 [Spirochaeta thermophila DSM 6578]|uniref:Lipoprotein n=1 Tax=Winmispira thermophila (strain ATCC 700085 / DSM 6578 / Z-1203) TaxID=869211 RepID=G0GCU9_WINT7|nr:hypothetical protein [Spirochaeta thermophila]AEJ60518.1 hypothetical protein Spith_0232 [Spirochaeta thermophila DSM 6578]
MKHRDKRTLVLGSMLLVLLGLLLTVGCANPVNSDIERIAASVTSEDGSQTTDDADLSGDTSQSGNESSEDFTATQSGEDPQQTVSQGSDDGAGAVSSDEQGAVEQPEAVAGGDAAEAEEDSLLAALEEAVAASKDLAGKVVIDGAGYLVISTDQGTYELAISDDPEELRDDLQDLWKEHKKDKELKSIAQELRKILASVTEASEREQGKKEKEKKRK